MMSDPLVVVIDEGRCIGSGNCVFWAPATFELGDEGHAVVLDVAAGPSCAALSPTPSACEIGGPRANRRHSFHCVVRVFRSIADPIAA